MSGISASSERMAIRFAQEMSVAELEARIAASREPEKLLVAGRWLTREACWAACASLRAAWAAGESWVYDGQRRDESGEWHAQMVARVHRATPGRLEVSLGRFPG